jgi:protein CpxP
MKKITIAIIAIAVLALGAIFVAAQKSGGGEGHGKRGFGHGRGHGGGGMMLRGLDLTDDQKNQVKQIMEASKSKVQPLRESMKANRDKLHQATADGKFDEAQVQALATEQANISAQLLVERTRTKSQIFQILTPEQRTKAAQMKESFKGGKKGWRHGGEKAPASEEE